MAVWSIVNTAEMVNDFRWDPEHYKPQILLQAKAMAKVPHEPLDKIATVSDGNHLSIAEEFSETGVRYLRGQDLSDFFISDTDPIYIPEKHYAALARSQMLSGDVLVCIVGATTGAIGLVTDRHGNLTGSCKLAIVRPRARTLPPEYIAAYLASRIGQNEIAARVRGAAQTGLILPDLRNIPVPTPAKHDLERIVEAVKGAQFARANAASHMVEAEELLVSSLGLGALDLSPSLYYERTFADLLKAQRFGAEYFMPTKQRVIKALTKKPYHRLSEHYDSIHDLFQPEAAKKKEVVRNFDLSDALEPFLDDTKESVSAREIGSLKKRMAPGDLVISRLRSYLREIAVVRTTVAVPTVGSTEFIVLRPRRATVAVETLLVYLRSAPVQAVLKWSQDGSNHPRFDEEDLLALPIPDAVIRAAPSIKKRVDAAIAAHREADVMLGSAREAAENIVFCDRKTSQ